MTITLKFVGVEGKAMGYQGDRERAAETYKEVRIPEELPIGQEVDIFDAPGGASLGYCFSRIGWRFLE